MRSLKNQAMGPKNPLDREGGAARLPAVFRMLKSEFSQLPEPDWHQSAKENWQLEELESCPGLGSGVLLASLWLWEKLGALVGLGAGTGMRKRMEARNGMRIVMWMGRWEWD